MSRLEAWIIGGVNTLSKYSNTILYNLRTTLDASGINSLKGELARVSAQLDLMGKKELISKSEVRSATKQIEALGQALSKSMNSSTGLVDLSSLKKELNELSLSSLQQSMAKAGSEGVKAFGDMLSTIGKMDTSTRSISSAADKIVNTFGNTVRWGITASLFQTMQNSLYRAVDYVKDLDTSLTNIRIVTGASNDSMRDFAQTANEAARSLGSSTVSFTDAAQLFAQNGFNEKDYTRLAEITQKVANVTQQDTTTVSEQVTALMAGYGMNIDQVEDALSGMSVVAAASAADLEELATAEQKVASTASSLGVSQEQLTAQIGTIVSVTRQAPETVGNALRTLYARIADLNMGETLEDGVSLGTVSKQLSDIGVQVLDETGNLRNLGDVLTDLQAKWGDLSDAQQIAIGTTVAGKYQLNPFMALMENADMYQEQYDMMVNSAGALDEQQAIYMDSIEARLQTLATTGEGVINSLFDPNDFKPFISGLTDVLSLIQQMVDAFGGADTILVGLGATATKVFSNQIGQSLTNMLANSSKNNTIKRSSDEILRDIGANGDSKTHSGTLNLFNSLYGKQDSMSLDQRDAYNAALEKTKNLENAIVDAKDKQAAAQKTLNDYLIKQYDMDARRVRSAISSSKDKDTVSKEMAKYSQDLEARAGVIGDALDTAHKRIYSLTKSLENYDPNDSDLKSVTNRALKNAIKNGNGFDVGSYMKRALFNGKEAGQAKALTAALNNAGVSADEFKEKLRNLGEVNSFDDIARQINRVVEIIKEYLNPAFNATQDKADFVNKLVGDVVNAQKETEDAERSAGSQRDANQAFIDSIDMQTRIQAVATLAGNIGQLAFAWQSFQSLGSLWADDDLTSTEKFSQTLEVMAFTFPSILSAFADMKSALDDLGISKLMAEGTQGLSGISKAMKQLQNLSGGAAEAIGTVFSAIASSIGSAASAIAGIVAKMAPLLAVTAAVSAIAMGIGAARQAEEDRVENIKEQADDATASFDSMKSASANFDELYEKYRQGEASSADLKEAADSLNQTLNDQTANAYAAAGAWDEYAKYVKNAEQTNIESTIAKQRAQLNETSNSLGGIRGVDREYDLPQMSSGDGMSFRSSTPSSMSIGDYSSITAEKYGDEIADTLKSSLSSLSGLVMDATGYFDFSSGSSASERYNDLLEAEKLLTEQLTRASEIYGVDSDQAKAAQELQSNLSELRARYSDQLDSQEQIVNDLMESAIAKGQNDESMQYDETEGLDAYRDKVRQYLQQIYGEGYDVSEEMVDSFVNGMASADTASAEALASDVGEEAARNNFQTNLEDKVNSTDLATSDAFESFRDSLASQGMDVSDLGAAEISAIKDQLIQSVLDQVNNSSLSEEDKATLMNNIDWSQPIEQILGQVTQAVNTGNVDAVNVNMDDLMNIGDDERQSSIEGYVDDSVLDTYRDIQSEQTELYDSQQALEEQSQSLSDAARQVAQDQGMESDAYKEAAEQAEDAQNQLEAYNDQQEDLVDMAVQSAKGLDELSESIDDNADIIRDGDESSLEYAEAIDETRQAVADLVNVSKDDISPQFVTDNLDDIEAAADGDTEAVERLRNAAAQEILMNINAEGNLTPEHLSYLQQKAQELSSMQISPFATLDDTSFVDTLNSMLANGEMTAEQVQSFLNSIGYSASITTKTVPVNDAYVISGSTVNAKVFGVDVPIEIPDVHINSSVTVPQISSIQSGVGSALAGALSKTSKKSNSSSGSSGSGGRKSSGSGGSGGRKSSGGSGSRGSSGSSYTPKSKDLVDDEVDRYERVNVKLDSLEKTLDKIAEDQDRLAGFDVADNMSKQISLIKQQITWTKKKMEIQKQEAQEYRDQLSATYGIMYDAEGHITNYADVYKRLLDNLNGLINQYNATSSESGQEALDSQIDSAQDNFDKFNDLIEKYDDLVSNSILESEKDIQDFYDKIEDLQIEAFQKSVDAVDNIKDLQEKLIDFNAAFTGLDSDSPFRSMMTSLDKLKTYWDVNTKSVDAYYDELIKRNNEAMEDASEQRKQELKYQNEVLEAARKQYGKGTFEAGGTGLFDMEMTNLNTILDQIRQFEENGTSTIFGENSGSIYEVGNDIFEQATSLLEDYEDELDDLKDAILDAIDDISDRMDERLDAYENINDELEHYADLIEMIHGEDAYDQLNQTSQATINNNKAAINELQQNITIWKDMLASMKEGSDEWKEVNENLTDAQQELLDKTSDTVQELLDVYERGVEKILDKWVGSTGMGSDLDWMSEEWELINRNADYYLDDVNAAYEIQKLQGKYLDLLDDADGLDVQNKITQQMQQQLGYLREKDKLSEYDVQYANAQLEILQKTIALQEAERNKSQLQLRRDTQGNYSYVYSADDDETRSAQSDLLEAQNSAYNLSKDQMQQTQDDSLSALQDARNMLSEIWTNANLTLEEKTKRTQTVIDSLKEYLAGTSEQLSESEKNIINDFIGMCDILTDENDERLQDVYEQIVNGNKDAFDQIDTRWQTSISKWLQNMEDFNTATDDAFQGLLDNFNDYQKDLDDLGDLAGMTFDDLSDSIQNAVDKTDDLASSTSSFINQLKNDAGTVKEYENNLAEMTAKIQDAENAMRAYQEQVNKLQSDLTAKEQENANLSSKVKDLQSQIDAMQNPGGSGGGGSGGGGGGGGGSSDLAWGIAQAIWTYGGASGWGNDPTRSSKLTGAYGSGFARQVQSIINQYHRTGKLVNYGSKRYSSYNLIGYKQGGYLGDRFTAKDVVPNSDGGKLFVGHPGEMVLNKEDTTNILNAVDTVRSMVAAARDGNYNGIIRQSSGMIDMDSIRNADQMGSANYYNVECSFPNATNVDDIQRAILTLPDIAPQYAYKS